MASTINTDCEAKDEGCLTRAPVMVTWGEPPMVLCVSCFRHLIASSNWTPPPKKQRTPVESKASNKAFIKALR